MRKGNFRIHSIMTVKNEADIIGSCIRAATKWSDHIIIYDGESEDDTWKISKNLEQEFPGKVIAWKQDGKVFSESLRSEVFNEYRSLSTNQGIGGAIWMQMNSTWMTREFFYLT